MRSIRSEVPAGGCLQLCGLLTTQTAPGSSAGSEP